MKTPTTTFTPGDVFVTVTGDLKWNSHLTHRVYKIDPNGVPVLVSAPVQDPQ